MATDKHLSIAPSVPSQADLNQPLSAAASVNETSTGIAAATPSSADRMVWRRPTCKRALASPPSSVTIKKM
jgi:hypothetical protein